MSKIQEDYIAALEGKLREARADAESWAQQADDRVKDCERFINQLADCQAETDNWRRIAKERAAKADHYDDLAEIARKHRIAAENSQANELRLRALVCEAKSIFIDPHETTSRAVIDVIEWFKSSMLVTPTGDQSVLREVIARVLEEVAEDWEEEVDVGIRIQADRIRSGEWTPEALK